MTMKRRVNPENQWYVASVDDRILYGPFDTLAEGRVYLRRPVKSYSKGWYEDGRLHLARKRDLVRQGWSFDDESNPNWVKNLKNNPTPMFVDQCGSCGEDVAVYSERQLVDGDVWGKSGRVPVCSKCRRSMTTEKRIERRQRMAEAPPPPPPPPCDHQWVPLAADAPARQWGATRYCAKCLKADKEKPQDENMIEQDPEKQRIAEAMVKYVHGRTLGPNMKADEARDLIRAYLRLEGYRSDSYGNFKKPSDPKHRYHFSKQRVQFQSRSPRGWSNEGSDLPGDLARRIVTGAAKIAGDTALADKFMAGRKAAAKRKIAGRKREEKRKGEVDALHIAQKAFAVESPDIALRIGSRVKVPSGKFAVAKERVHNLSMQWADHLLGGGEPPPDSAFATVDYPPILPVFFPYTYDWTETVDGVEYSIHVEHGEYGTANVMIGGHGNFAVDPMTHRMFVPKYKPVGDAQISGRIVWDDSGKELAGMLFLITSLNKRRGAGSRVMQLWCRMMRGYGIEAWIAEAVGAEGMAFFEALAAKQTLAILGADRKNLVVACTGQLPPRRKPKGAKPSSKRPDTPAIVQAVIAGAAGQKRPSKRPSPKRSSSKQVTSYLVEMMQWDGMQQIEDRKQRVKSMDKAIEVAIGFVKGRPRPKLAKVFVTAMAGRSKKGIALLLMGKDGVWHIQQSGGLESEAQADVLLAGLGEARASEAQPNPVSDNYFQPNPMYQPNPPWADKLLVRDWKVLSDQARHLKMPMPVREGQAKSFAELGCGVYGCVYPTADESVVFKLTSDPDEIRFVEAAMAIGDFPDGIVRYYATAPMLGKYRKRDVVGIWREAAVEVGLPTYLARATSNDERMFNRAGDLLMQFKDLAYLVKQYAMKRPDKVREIKMGEIPDFEPEDFKIDWYSSDRYRYKAQRRAANLRGADRVRYCLNACRYLAESMVNDQLMYHIGEALLFYMAKGILLADVHRNNVGKVVRPEMAREPIWVITDPGHAVSIPPVWSFVEPDVAEASSMNPTGSYTMGVEKPTEEALRRWAKRARALGMEVTVRGGRGIATGTAEQWEQAKGIMGAPVLTWVWDESLQGPATHAQVVRRRGAVWLGSGSSAEPKGKLLDPVIVRVIYGIYGTWRQAKRYDPKRPEPCMTVGRIKDELDQRTVPENDYRFASDKSKTSMIRTSLTRLVREGKLAKSEGIGLTGKPATCYEPVRDNPVGKPRISIRRSKSGRYSVTGTDKFGNKVSHKAANREEAKAIRNAYHRIISDDPELVERDIARVRKWYARPRSNPVGKDPYVYHVTFYNRLGAIASSGLMPIGGMHGSALGKGGYAGHSQGKVFVTERDGISFWYGRAEDAANDSSDDVLVEGYTPVVLRMRKPKGMKVDEAGSDDAGYDAWYVKKAIDPDGIEAWTGQAWVRVDRAEDLIDQAASYDMDDGYAYLKSDWDNPLVSFLQEEQ